MYILSVASRPTNLNNDIFVSSKKKLKEEPSSIGSKQFSLSDYGISRVYAQTMPNFKSSLINNTSFELILTNEQKDPRIRFEIIKNEDFETKKGIFPIYQMALNDQMFEEMSNNPDITDNGSHILTNSRKLDIRCPQEELVNVLAMIQRKFINLDIKQKHFEDAKLLSPIAYELDRAAGYYSTEFSDVPKDMTTKDYTEIVDQISYQDMLDYNNELMKKSNKHVQLFINKDFYNGHKEEIIEITNKWI